MIFLMTQWQANNERQTSAPNNILWLFLGWLHESSFVYLNTVCNLRGHLVIFSLEQVRTAYLGCLCSWSTINSEFWLCNIKRKKCQRNYQMNNSTTKNWVNEEVIKKGAGNGKKERERMKRKKGGRDNSFSVGIHNQIRKTHT